MMRKAEGYREDTNLIHAWNEPDGKTGAIAPRILPAVTYAFETAESAAAVVSGIREGFQYGRYGNPTIRQLEQKIASMEGAEDAVALSSGMAAISAALIGTLQAGDHVVATRDVYGGTYKFLTNLAPRFGIDVDFVDCTDLEKVKAAIRKETKVLYIETPSNPCLTILDIRALADAAHEAGLTVIIDNTFLSPYLQKPHELGCDLVVHSATKYLNGHGDVLAGFICGRQEQIQFIRKQVMGDLGQCLNAWEAFLILRGLKTLGLRMHKHCDNAEQVARYLASHPFIHQVFYPGLGSHPGHEVALRQMKRMGGIVSFEVRGGLEGAKAFLNSLQLAAISFSLGDPETLVQHPATMTHASIPAEQRAEFGITDGLIRLSLGLEDAADILADLQQALAAAETAVHQCSKSS